MGDAAKKEEPQDTAAALRELADAIRASVIGTTAPAAEEWMTLDQAAAWLGLHEQTIRETISAEDPPWAKRFGRAIRISRTLLLQAPPIERRRAKR
jgi:excisionase family DNA binding protein